jgi:phage tail sheath gpL-like
MGVPSNFIVPFVGVEFDNSRASKGPAVLNFQTLIFGQKTAAGFGTAGQSIKVSTADEVGRLAGFGSQIHQIAKSYFKNNKVTDTFIYMLADASSSTAAAFSITVTATSATAGEIDIYIDGYRIPVSVAVDATATEIATSIVTAMTAVEAYIPVTTIASSSGVVTFVAKNKGTVGNGTDIRFNYYEGELMPDGVECVSATVTAGTIDPTVDTMIEALGEEWYQVWVGPYTDATNLDAIETELLDRADVIRQIDGLYISARKGSDAELIAYSTATGRNCQYVITGAAEDYPNSVGQIAGAVAGAFAASAADDAAKPLHRIALEGILPPKKEDRKKIVNRNSLAIKGLMTFDPGNGVQTEACVTMYLTNSSGAADTSYQQATAMFTLMVLRYRFRNAILTKYARAKLADSADNIGPGQQIITPAIGKAEAIMWFRQAESDGLVENFDQFKNEVVCIRDTSNRNRLNWILPPDLMNQFIVGSATMQFIN